MSAPRVKALRARADRVQFVKRDNPMYRSLDAWDIDLDNDGVFSVLLGSENIGPPDDVPDYRWHLSVRRFVDRACADVERVCGHRAPRPAGRDVLPASAAPQRVAERERARPARLGAARRRADRQLAPQPRPSEPT